MDAENRRREAAIVNTPPHPRQQQSPQPQHRSHSSHTQAFANFSDAISPPPDQWDFKQVGAELVSVVNSAKAIAEESKNPDKVARVTALLQQFVLEGKDMLVKAKDNSPSFLSSKVQLTQTLRSVVLALSESDPTPSYTQPQQHTVRTVTVSTTSTTSSSPPIYSSTPTTGSIPAADRARVRLNSFLSSLGRPRAQSYNDQGSFHPPPPDHEFMHAPLNFN